MADEQVPADGETCLAYQAPSLPSLSSVSAAVVPRMSLAVSAGAGASYCQAPPSVETCETSPMVQPLALLVVISSNGVTEISDA